MPILPKPLHAFEPAPEGTHAAVCIRIIDLGTQDATFGGKVSRKRQVLFTWQLLEERRSDGKPFTVTTKYTWSMGEKAALKKVLESWRGKSFGEADFEPGGFDLKQLLGKPCLVTIKHTERNGVIYANVVGIAKLPKTMTVGGPEGETMLLWLSRAEFDARVFDGLSDKLKDIIRNSPEYQALSNGTPDDTEFDPGHDPDDDLPF